MVKKTTLAALLAAALLTGFLSPAKAQSGGAIQATACAAR